MTTTKKVNNRVVITTKTDSFTLKQYFKLYDDSVFHVKTQFKDSCGTVKVHQVNKTYGNITIKALAEVIKITQPLL